MLKWCCCRHMYEGWEHLSVLCRTYGKFKRQVRYTKLNKWTHIQTRRSRRNWLFSWSMLLSLSCCIPNFKLSWCCSPTSFLSLLGPIASLAMAFDPADPARRAEIVERAEIISRFTVLHALPLLTLICWLLHFVLACQGTLSPLDQFNPWSCPSISHNCEHNVKNKIHRRKTSFWLRSH